MDIYIGGCGSKCDDRQIRLVVDEIGISNRIRMEQPSTTLLSFPRPSLEEMTCHGGSVPSSTFSKVRICDKILKSIYPERPNMKTFT